MNNWFVIERLSDFVDATRVMVFTNFGSDDNKKTIQPLISLNDLSDQDLQELNKILSYSESLLIVKEHTKKQRNKMSSKIRRIISEKDYMSMINDLHSRMISNIMKELVQKGLVETAFDSKHNDFIFWIKDENHTKEKPETD